MAGLETRPETTDSQDISWDSIYALKRKLEFRECLQDCSIIGQICLDVGFSLSFIEAGDCSDEGV